MIDEYIAHGWCLTPLLPQTKMPARPEWNTKEEALHFSFELPPGHGVGLMHAFSGTMSLDIDDFDNASRMLLDEGVDIVALQNAEDSVILHSGVAGRTKLLYRLDSPLPSKRIGSAGTVFFELRCGTAGKLSVQDVLPPSIHPETLLPYQWKGNGHWSRLPVIPPALLEYWEKLNESSQSFPSSSAPVEEVKKALDYIDPSCSREDWITVGMALHFADPINFNMWNEWSSPSKKYKGERDLLGQWESFKKDKEPAITLASLFHIALKYGYRPPAPNLGELFRPKALRTPTSFKKLFRPDPPDIEFAFLPNILGIRAKEVARCIGCDPLVPLWASIAAVCGVVDARTRLELMPGYKVPPILWLMTIGEPADKKSPGARPVMSILKDLEISAIQRFKIEHLEWEAKEVMHESAKKAFLQFFQSSEAMLSTDTSPGVPDLPPEPVPLKLVVSDITSQKLVRDCQGRPRGLLCYLDEMNSWVNKVNDLRSGEDRSAWVQSYEGEPYQMDRVGGGSFSLDNFAVSIYGNIQPRVLRKNLDMLASDGLIQRFLPVILRSQLTTVGEPIPEFLQQKGEWDAVLKRIFELPSTTYRLNDSGLRLFKEFQHWYSGIRNAHRLVGTPDAFMTAFGKIEGTLGRFILIFHLIEAPMSVTVDAHLVAKTIEFVKHFVIPTLQHVLSEFSEQSTIESWVIDWVVQNCKEETFSVNDILRRGSRFFGTRAAPETAFHIESTLILLERSDWVKKLKDSSAKHSSVWAMNPNLAVQFEEYLEGLSEARKLVSRKVVTFEATAQQETEVLPDSEFQVR